MKLVEAESTGPVEGDAALVTPPRPPHRRVSVSLVFTLTVLVGTVVTIFAMFPARHNLLMTEAIAHHREPGPAWDLTAPTRDALRAWMIGAVGKDAPLPGEATTVVGARQLDILNRAAALVRLRIGDDDVTYLVQRARGIAPEGGERVDGTLRAVAWRRGRFTVVAVGADASAARWRASLR
ncbi:MAG TPA: hypothetical protein VHW23_10270 [Kofleriaceae bacterium]|jgi:hypothetical protein|nr:hypothetical protein [Kofleriaceae bacterium]